MSDVATEVMFYHLDRQPIERVLPQLLEKSRNRGWDAVVQARDSVQLRLIDDHLWTYAEGSFLPHCLAEDPRARENRVVLTIADDNPNSAQIRFLLDGSSCNAIAGYRRCVHLFDGTDPAVLALARAAWKAAKSLPATLSYWQQADSGQWQQKA